jgi:hypothetical protein
LFAFVAHEILLSQDEFSELNHLSSFGGPPHRYIEANQTEVEAEYQKVLKETEELRLYYEEQNRERVARIAT